MDRQSKSMRQGQPFGFVANLFENVAGWVDYPYPR